ncbi:MAG: glucohydrolase, partial [Bacteroidales bacterium]|nr:glucohydrolase [Bacteroidales bacterium]
MKTHLSSFLLLIMLSSCNPKPEPGGEKQWWKETVFYEIYMPSFKDSHGDGFSDFKGMTSKLDYLQSLGIKGIWLTPFYQSPKIDNGYDISDYLKVDETYGNPEDFNTFITEAHQRDIKVIIDMVVNHTSTEHRWFQESRKSIDNPYRDYYIWKDVPNNWESFFGGKAWQYDSLTQQYYYHKFAPEMADLNWQNPKVTEEIQNIFRFWLDSGVDGFRLDVINFLTTAGITHDNPMDEKGRQIHVYDLDQKGVKQAMKTIYETINEYDNRFVAGEIGSDKIEVLRQYQGKELLDVVFNFNFGSIP